MNKNLLFTILGPAVFTLSLLFETPDNMTIGAYRLIGITAWMAIWWTAEVVPIAVTALLPILLFPSAEILSIADTGANYGHKYIFLFIGGFMIANAIQKWNLHRRIALTIISLLGSSTERIILGFMLATAFLSM